LTPALLLLLPPPAALPLALVLLLLLLLLLLGLGEYSSNSLKSARSMGWYMPHMPELNTTSLMSQPLHSSCNTAAAATPADCTQLITCTAHATAMRSNRHQASSPTLISVQPCTWNRLSCYQQSSDDLAAAG
jgi:hypothetical protein